MSSEALASKRGRKLKRHLELERPAFLSFHSYRYFYFISFPFPLAHGLVARPTP